MKHIEQTKKPKQNMEHTILETRFLLYEFPGGDQVEGSPPARQS